MAPVLASDFNLAGPALVLVSAACIALALLTAIAAAVATRSWKPLLWTPVFALAWFLGSVVLYVLYIVGEHGSFYL